MRNLLLFVSRGILHSGAITEEIKSRNRRKERRILMSTQTKNWPALLAEEPETWQPSADVYRTKDGWLVKFDLAGVQIGDVTVALRGRRLIVSGVRRDSFLEEGSSY